MNSTAADATSSGRKSEIARLAGRAIPSSYGSAVTAYGQPAARGLLRRRYEGFTLALACKDLGLAVDLARAAGVPAEASALVEQACRRARARYGDSGGEMLPMKLTEDLTGHPLRL